MIVSLPCLASAFIIILAKIVFAVRAKAGIDMAKRNVIAVPTRAGIQFYPGLNLHCPRCSN
jgi:hypothetical protein